MKKFLSYGRQHIDQADINAVVDILKSDFITQGPVISRFEQAICQYSGAKFCVAVANGTAALHLAVKALDVDNGMQGITSTNSFIASANALVYNQLQPRLADIDEASYSINPNRLENHISTKTRIVIPVHFAGQPVDMTKLAELRDKYNFHIIEDAAHAIGSKYQDGSPVGNCKYSDMTIFSFHPVKTITTGEGGAVTTNNSRLYEKLQMLRNHGITKSETKLQSSPGPWYYEMQDLGFNYRMTDIQAALGLSQLKKLDSFIIRRRQIVDRYNSAFQGTDWLTTPYEAEDVFSAFHLYVLKINFNKINSSRIEVMQILKSKNIGTQVHYIPIHTQPYYQNRFNYRAGDFPVAENYYRQALSIPLYPGMTDDDVEYVINSILELPNES